MVNRSPCSVSTLPLTLDTAAPHRAPGSRVGACAEPTPSRVGLGAGLRPGIDVPGNLAGSAVQAALDRAARPDYARWLAHVSPVGACTQPIRLRGMFVDPTTGAITVTTDLPDGVIYVACGNRRTSVCPSCAELYRADTYQMIKAGLVGGKTVPGSVREHPCVFLTATAPSFGPVHSTRAGRDGHPRPCRPRRLAETCVHGRTLACTVRHEDGDPAVGQPFCLDCYDHAGQVVWNAYVGELWRRTLLKVNKALRGCGARASFAKVAEMQARGVVHLHAVIRLDALLPDLVTDTLPDGTQHARLVPAPPLPRVGVPQLRRALEDAFTTTTFTTPPHPRRPRGWLVAWGEQLDVRTVRDPDLTGDPAALTDEQVAGYLAKYATKATEATGHTSARLTPETVAEIVARREHIANLIAACWKLGHPAADEYAYRRTGKRTPARLRYARLRRWAHVLGFGGHFSTKSRRYSVTLGALRHARVDWRHAHRRPLRTADPTEQTTLLVGELAFAGMGWHTTGDALLAATAAAKARDQARALRDHLQDVVPARTIAA